MGVTIPQKFSRAATQIRDGQWPLAMWMRQHADTSACQNPRGQTFRSGHAAYNRPYSLSCVVDILCICVFYVFYLIVFAGQANLCCGATPPSLMVLFHYMEHTHGHP